MQARAGSWLAAPRADRAAAVLVFHGRARATGGCGAGLPGLTQLQRRQQTGRDGGAHGLDQAVFHRLRRGVRVGRWFRSGVARWFGGRPILRWFGVGVGVLRGRRRVVGGLFGIGPRFGFSSNGRPIASGSVVMS